MKNKFHVLIVEDLPSDAELAQRELKTVLQNFTVQVLDTKEDYIQALEKFKPDLIISDYQMPVFDGLSALKIKQEKLPFTPFVLLTGSINEDTAVECIHSGADDYVIKEHIKRLGPAVLQAIEKKKNELEAKQSNDALRNRERVYSTLINNLPGFTYRCQNDENWTMNYISAGCEDITGYTPDDLTNNKTIAFNDIIREDYRKKVWEDWQKVLKEKTVYEGEYQILAKNKEVKWIWERGCGIYSDKGELLFLEGFITDITERKEAEDAVCNERDNMMNIFKAMKDGIYIVNKQYDIEYVNHVLVKDFGAYKEKKCYEYFHDRTEVCPWCKNPEVFEEKKTVHWEWTSFKNSKTYDLIDTPLINNDGSISKLQIFRDITERKKDEVELIKLSSAVKQSPSVITITDLKGSIEYANPKFTDLTGYSSEEVIGKNPRILNSGEQAKEIYKDLWNKIKNGKEWRGEFHNKRKNGTLFWEAASISPIFNKEGEITNYLKLAEDITERKKVVFELLESEKRFKSLFNGLGDAIFVAKIGGADKGEILEINPAAEIQTGYTRNELLKMNIIKDISISGSEDINANDWDEKLQKGEIVVTSEKKRKKDGSEYWTEAIVTTIDFKGEKASLSINHDITDRMQAEEELKRKMNELEIFNDASVNREVMINDLRKEINELLKKNGEEAKYKIFT